MIWKKSEMEETTAQPHPQPQPQQQVQPQPTPPPRPQNTPAKDRAMIGPSIEVKGSLAGGEDLCIEGRVEGKIEVRQHSVTVGKSGRVKADIFGRTIMVQGEVDGNLFGEEQIILHQSSAVHGNLQAPRVTIEDGSHFKGSIDMTPKTAPDMPPPKVPGVELKQPVAPVQRYEKPPEKI